MESHTTGALYGLTAAVLFGVRAPIAKLFMSEVFRVFMAGLLYAGGGLASECVTGGGGDGDARSSMTRLSGGPTSHC